MTVATLTAGAPPQSVSFKYTDGSPPHTRTVDVRGGRLTHVVQKADELTTSRNRVDVHRLVVHIAGNYREYEIDIDGLPVSSKPPFEGDLTFIPAHYECRETFRTRHVERVVIEVDPAHWPEFKFCPDIAPRHLFRNEFVYQAAHQVSFHLLQSYKESEQFVEAQVIALIHYTLLSVLKQSSSSGVLGHAVFTPTQYRTISSIIDDNIDSRISVSDLANAVGMSERVFVDSFCTSYGKTPTQHIISRRVAKGKDLLSTTTMDITDIANLVGFSSHAHFTRTFQRYYGVSPSFYRRNVRD